MLLAAKRLWINYYALETRSFSRILLLFVGWYQTLAGAGIGCRHVSVRPSVASRCSTETAKRRITQTTPHDSPGTLVFWCRKYRSPPTEAPKCRRGWLNAGEVAENWRLSTRSVVNLARSHVYHIACLQHVSPWYMQRVALVCQRHLILVTYRYLLSLLRLRSRITW